MEIKISKNKYSVDWIDIFIFIIVVVSNDTYFWGTNSVDVFLSIPRYGSIFLCIFLLAKKIVYPHFHKKMQLLYFFIILIYLVSCIYNKSTITITGIYAIYITLAFLISTRISFKKFFDSLEKIIYFISIFSLVIELILYCFPAFASLFPVMKNYAGVDIINFGFSGILKMYINTPLKRNNGIFWEPGVFQIYINLSLAYCIFFKPQVVIKRIIVYGLMVFFTFSTTGYIAYLFLLIIYVKASKIRKTNKIILCVIFALLALATLFVDIGSPLFLGVFGKLFDNKNGSTLARIASVIADIKIGLTHPFFGIGMNSVTEQTQIIAREELGVYVNSNTNGILYPLAAYGIPFEILYMFGTFIFPINFTKNKFDSLLLIILIILVFISERLMSPFPYIIMFYGYSALFNKKTFFKNRELILQEE